MIPQMNTGRTPVDSLDFVKVTEAAALAASRWMGRGERNIADGAAVEKMREALEMPLLAVGAAFAFHAGLLPQAPPLMQKWGLEWLFRLVQEPLRLWRRYLLLNPLYVTLLLLQASRLYTIDPNRVPAVVEPLRHG